MYIQSHVRKAFRWRAQYILKNNYTEKAQLRVPLKSYLNNGKIDEALERGKQRKHIVCKLLQIIIYKVFFRCSKHNSYLFVDIAQPNIMFLNSPLNQCRVQQPNNRHRLNNNKDRIFFCMLTPTTYASPQIIIIIIIIQLMRSKSPWMYYCM